MATPELRALEVLIGDWTVEARHPSFPDTVGGSASFEWLAGKRFLIQRSHADHPDIPDTIAIIGASSDDEGLRMHYFDSRGVHRIYGVSMRENEWRMWRDAPGFSQRFRGELRDDGRTLAGLWKLSQDDETWADDLEITFRRQADPSS
jgi:hypothetical protein